MPDDERQAIKRLQQGDIGGLELLVRRYQLFAQRAAFGVLGDRYLAEDAAQVAFITAFNRINAYNADLPFRQWLGGIVVREAKHLARERTPELLLSDLGTGDRPLLEELVQRELRDADTALERADLRMIVGEALRKLTPNQRAMIIERYYVERSAAHDGANSPTARSTLRHARDRLRRWLAEDGFLAAHSKS